MQHVLVRGGLVVGAVACLSSAVSAGMPGDDWSLGPVAPAVLLQLANPADAQRASAEEAKALDAARAGRAPEPVRDTEPRLRSWELPAVTVSGEEPAGLREEDRVGSYGQPRWTATRRFPGTRVYVVPEGKVEVEYWLRPTFNENGETETRSLYEIEFGLPHRFQLDIYLRADSGGNYEETKIGQQLELRYALADWGKLWGNPTLYAEWVILEQAADKVEFKLLLGDELAPRWHWGVNLVGEFETGGERAYEYQSTGGLSYTVIDSRFSVGVEGIWQFADVKGDRGNFTNVFFLGPSIQFRPTDPLTFNIVTFAGIGGNSPDGQMYVNVAYEF